MAKENTRKSIKHNVDAAERRRRQREHAINLRKDKKVENLTKRRAMMAPPLVTETSASSVGDSNADNTMHVSSGPETTKTFTVFDINVLQETLQSPTSDDAAILHAIRGFRRLLSVEKAPPVVEVLDSGALPIFVKLLEHRHDDIILEAAWALTNVASTEHTAAVVDHGAVPYLVNLLLSANEHVREQCAWCLGNIAGDSPKLRDCILQAGAMEPILKNIEHPANTSLLGNVVWTLSNFCRGKPQPEISLVKASLPHLLSIVQSNPNKDIAIDACWALSYLCDGDDERIQQVMEIGVTQKLVEFLSDSSTSLIAPALRTLGNFATGNDEQTQAVVDCLVLDRIPKLLANPKRNIRKDAYWLLSNIAAGTRKQIHVLVSKPQIVVQIVTAMKNSEWEVRKEAIWVAYNITTGGNDHHVQALVHFGAIEALCSMLHVPDTKVLILVLDTLENILKVGERQGKAFDCLVDEADGIDKLEDLQKHESDAIFQKAVAIIEKYFQGEEVENENLAPVSHGNAFAFGATQKLFEDEDPANNGTQPPLFNF